MPQARNGEIVRVETNNAELLGYGFFSPNSQISCRVFEFTDIEMEPNSNYWKQKIKSAWELRRQIIRNNTTNIYRLIHAEGDFFPGLIVDVYANVAVVQILIKGVELISADVFEALKSLGFPYIYLKTKQNTQLLEGVIEGNKWVFDAHENPVVASENGIQFYVDVEKGQKTGFFIDQRDNRQLLGEFSAGKTVLNTFCYSGGFSLYALKNGAIRVDSVDSSKEAIGLCTRNAELNNLENKHQTYVEDCFDFLKNNPENYDSIVLDPPAFAKHSRAVDNAARGYKNLNMLGIKKVNPGGLVFTFSCSQHIDKELFRKIVFSAAAECKRNVRIIRQLNQSDDHPINIYHPEGEYLKGLLLQVE